ncbi:MAG: FKBP-type peptidyl-prolyl cis-trans isomerase [Bacteroidales bacterium]|nr:FKBP-type peptidyl-prolyl cis-trans isomerase [Bacteroidales bacterium]
MSEFENQEQEEIQENVTPQENPAQENAENTVHENVEETSPKPTEKKKTGLVIGIICGILVLAGIICGILAATGAFSKYKGFKKDRQTGLYYQFYGDINDTAAMPQTGDLVGVLFNLRAGDSLLIPMMPNQMIIDSIYKGDFYSALRMMHVGDSATFIFNGQEFFQNFMQGQEYPFGDTPLYSDVKLYGLMPKAEFEQMQAEYEQMMRESASQEAEKIEEYVKENNIKATPTPEGIYITTTKKGTGALPKNGDNLEVHYTGKLLDGTVFDSSLPRNEPFVFTLGNHEVIPGWEIALSKMHVGEKATILLPSSMAYGERGSYSIPPYSPLVFDVEFLRIVPESEMQQKQ